MTTSFVLVRCRLAVCPLQFIITLRIHYIHFLALSPPTGYAVCRTDVVVVQAPEIYNRRIQLEEIAQSCIIAAVYDIGRNVVPTLTDTSHYALLCLLGSRQGEEDKRQCHIKYSKVLHTLFKRQASI